MRPDPGKERATTQQSGRNPCYVTGPEVLSQTRQARGVLRRSLERLVGPVLSASAKSGRYATRQAVLLGGPLPRSARRTRRSVRRQDS